MIGKAQTSTLSIRIRNDHKITVPFKIVFYTDYSSEFEVISKDMSAGEVLSYTVDLKDPTVSNYRYIALRVYYEIADKYDVTINNPDEWFGKGFFNGTFMYGYYEHWTTLEKALTIPNIDKGYLFHIEPYR